MDYMYECLECESIGTADEWNAQTAITLYGREVDSIPSSITPIQKADWNGGSWYACPACREQSFSEHGSIRRIVIKPASNAEASVLLQKAW